MRSFEDAKHYATGAALLSIIFSLSFAQAIYGTESLEKNTGALSQSKDLSDFVVEDMPELTQRFRSDKVWNGGDGAITLTLAPGKILWLFGDSFIKKGRMKDRTMINNSVAVQNTEKRHEDWHFYFRGSPEDPKSIFIPNEKKHFYWPGCGTIYNGRLYLLLKNISLSNELPAPFNFSWKSTDLVVVDNPLDVPSAWRYSKRLLPNCGGNIDWAIATHADAKHLYVFCLGKTVSKSVGEKPVKLARILLTDLQNGKYAKWEFAADKHAVGGSPGSWSQDYTLAKSIMPVGGPEMSVFYSPKNKCYVSLFQEPMSEFVSLAVARNIDDTWTKPRHVYRVSETKITINGKKALAYAGKAHPVLSDSDGIVFTYCVNPGGEAEHLKRPDLYFPVARKLILRSKTVARMLESAGK
ncbi:MAG: DUF4185 domain-containing protein [Leptolyngbya sp.]|nr:DUF4185 domain-containing protein [Candidatus Melainabacteria bacterium]